MDSFSQVLDWLFAAGQALSCVCLVYGAYIALRHLSSPFTEKRTDLGSGRETDALSSLRGVRNTHQA
jgi:hypothetical protein